MLKVALAGASISLTALALEALMVASGIDSAALATTASLINGRFNLGLDCYPSNPRSYFDVDLRDADTRERYRRARVRHIDRAWTVAPHAVELRYNSIQYRDVEVPPRRASVRRVIVLGDSFTEGQGVKEVDTYPRVLERLLNEAEPGRWEVRNWGRRGADFPVLSGLFDEALGYHPDVVVYGMVLNDAERPQEFDARHDFLKNPIVPRRRPWEFRSRLVGFVAGRVETWKLDREGKRCYHELYGEPNREGWTRTQRQIVDMSRRMRERGGEFLLAAWPLMAGLEDDYPFASVHETIRHFCLESGVAHHDLLPALKGRPSESLWVHPLDHHPNDEAHRRAAESLALALLERVL
ncbi:MAG TPA: GDSL-type esterase/lipase family protein [Vicinamibacteria bacterium]